MNFKELGIVNPILKALEEEGYTAPSPIQEQAIPHLLEGRDLLGCAQTGTGKTAAFAIPILQAIGQQHGGGHRPTRALILTPTRELAIQIEESFKAYGRHMNLRTVCIYGGVSQKPQVDRLKKGADIVVATPGRWTDRYEQGLSLGMHELMYPVLQAYDSVAINSDVELGATEQKFNILCGRDMQRYYSMEQQVAVLSPILLGTDGVNKMGKSLNNYIAVFDPPAEKFGKVMSIPDSLILNYYNYATSYSPQQLSEVKELLANGTNPMILKKKLAWEIVALYHGETEAQKAQEGFESLFSKGEIPEDIAEYEVTNAPQRIVNLLVASGLCATNGEAKRLIQGGGVSIDGEKVNGFDAELVLINGQVLRAGKRKFIKIKVV